MFVDANGAYSRKQAIAQAEIFTEYNVSWFEEPVSSDDLEGLRLVRDRAPAAMDIAAGEYGYDIFYFRRMLAAGAVDVQQADITRCGGVTGILQVAHCAKRITCRFPATPPRRSIPTSGCAIPAFRNLEYFHDHVRIERMFFDGFPQLVNGELRPDLSRPGIGLELKTRRCGNGMPREGVIHVCQQRYLLISPDELKNSPCESAHRELVRRRGRHRRTRS